MKPISFLLSLFFIICTLTSCATRTSQYITNRPVEGTFRTTYCDSDHPENNYDLYGTFQVTADPLVGSKEKGRKPCPEAFQVIIKEVQVKLDQEMRPSRKGCDLLNKPIYIRSCWLESDDSCLDTCRKALSRVTEDEKDIQRLADIIKAIVLPCSWGYTDRQCGSEFQVYSDDLGQELEANCLQDGWIKAKYKHSSNSKPLINENNERVLEHRDVTYDLVQNSKNSLEIYNVFSKDVVREVMSSQGIKRSKVCYKRTISTLLYRKELKNRH